MSVIKMEIFEPELINMEKYKVVAQALANYLTAELPKSDLLVSDIPRTTNGLLTYVTQTKEVLSRIKDAKELLSLTGQSYDAVKTVEDQLNESLEKVKQQLPSIAEAEKDALVSGYKQKRIEETKQVLNNRSYADPLSLHRGLQMFEKPELERAKGVVANYLFDNSYLKKFIESSAHNGNLRPIQEALFLLADYVNISGHDKSSEEFVTWYVTSIEDHLEKAGKPRIADEVLKTAPELAEFNGIIEHAKVFGKLPGMPICYETKEIPSTQVQGIEDRAVRVIKGIEPVKARQPDKKTLEKPLDYATWENGIEQAIVDYFELNGKTSVKHKLASMIYRIAHNDINAAVAVVRAFESILPKHEKEPDKLMDIADAESVINDTYKNLKPKQKGKRTKFELEQLIADGIITVHPQHGNGNPIKIIKEAHTTEYLKLESLIIEDAKEKLAGKRMLVLNELPLDVAREEAYRQKLVSEGMLSDIDEYIEIGMLLGLYATEMVEKAAEIGAAAFPIESEAARVKFLKGLKMVSEKYEQVSKQVEHMRSGSVITNILTDDDIKQISEITGINIDHYRNLFSDKTLHARKDIDRVAEKLLLQLHILDGVPGDTNCNREKIMAESVAKLSKFADDTWLIVGWEHARDDSRLLRGLEEKSIAYQLIDVDYSRLPLDLKRQNLRHKTIVEASGEGD